MLRYAALRVGKGLTYKKKQIQQHHSPWFHNLGVSRNRNQFIVFIVGY
jgi:hypothetical protein